MKSNAVEVEALASTLEQLRTDPLPPVDVAAAAMTSTDWTRERQRRLELKELYDEYADTYAKPCIP